METISGYVEHIVFRNADNGYTVFSLALDDYEEMTCVGNAGNISEGEFLEVTGELIDHPVYGVQMKLRTVTVKVPEDAAAMERYLGSGSIKGIGPKLAAQIVRKFGDDTFRIIEEEPERLAEVKGISERKAMDISIQMEEKRDMRRAMLFLQEYGISMNLAAKIYEYYDQELYKVIRENPYRMADDIEGVGFRIADEIASRVGIQVDSDFRIRSGLLYILSQAQGEGHVFLPEEMLVGRAQEILGVDREIIAGLIPDLALDRKIVIRKLEDSGKAINAIYLQNIYNVEYHTALMLNERNVSYKVNEDEVLYRIRRIETRNKIDLDDMQKTAVLSAIKNGLMVITGGPGTGKTTTIHTLIEYFEEEGMDIALAAPTGRAARRMSEATGREASTIHRLLEVNAGDLENGRRVSFLKNQNDPLTQDVVIIDELSMVDIFLMHSLLMALSVGTRLILVGDMNQLPSVGPGSVLRDIIASHNFNVVMLTKVFRQAAMSDIIVNAHRINHGEPPVLDNDSRDFFFLRRNDVNLIISNLITLINQKMVKYLGVSPWEVQVLTPMRKGPLGVERLNRILQEHVNPPSPDKVEKEINGILYREGDKVMQIKNDYQLVWKIRGKNGIEVDEGLGIFNGDIGVIRDIDSYSQEITIVFDDNREVIYSYPLMEEVELAYAITVHKSQGSEYPAVLMPLLSGSPLLMNRNLLYTAVTRAKSCVVLLGSEQVINDMVNNTREVKRYTNLAGWIRESGETF